MIYIVLSSPFFDIFRDICYDSTVRHWENSLPETMSYNPGAVPTCDNMKKLFTIDDIMIAFVSALGYGLSETISRLMGWPKPVGMAATLVVGIALESIINRIVFSEAVQKKPEKRALIYIAFILIFLVVHTVTVSSMGVSMVHYLVEQFVYVVGFPILGFFVNLLIRAYRVRRIRRLYGDGSKGFVFDLKDKDIEEANRQNQPVDGEYDADCVARTRTGIYVGERQGKTVCFMGIPYARPPVGERRWKAPEPLEASQAVFEAKYFGASPIQVGHRGSIVRHHRQSKDCLYLNVCVGVRRRTPKSRSSCCSPTVTFPSAGPSIPCCTAAPLWADIPTYCS